MYKYLQTLPLPLSRLTHFIERNNYRQSQVLQASKRRRIESYQHVKNRIKPPLFPRSTDGINDNNDAPAGSLNVSVQKFSVRSRKSAKRGRPGRSASRRGSITAQPRSRTVQYSNCRGGHSSRNDFSPSAGEARLDRCINSAIAETKGKPDSINISSVFASALPYVHAVKNRREFPLFFPHGRKRCRAAGSRTVPRVSIALGIKQPVDPIKTVCIALHETPPPRHKRITRLVTSLALPYCTVEKLERESSRRALFFLPFIANLSTKLCEANAGTK